MKKYCSNCGTQLENGECPKCGVSYSDNGVINRVKIKKTARDMVSKDFWLLLKPILIVFVIEAIIEVLNYYFIPDKSYFSNIISGFGTLITAPLSVGLIECYLCYIRGKEFKVTDIFNFYDKRILAVWGVTILCSIFIMLWSLLFIIPGIIAAFSYSMVHYILADNETLNCMEIIKRSKYMMNGYKNDYFLFMMSFIGWAFLCIFTYGIALVYVLPYVQLSNSLYYEELKKIKS